jgi:hypothetical protein
MEALKLRFILRPGRSVLARKLFLPSVLGRLRSPLASVIAPLSRGEGELSWVWGKFLWKHALRLGLRRAGPPQLRSSQMLPSGGRTALASRAYNYFGAESSRPASLLCTLRTPRRPVSDNTRYRPAGQLWAHGICTRRISSSGSPSSLLHLWFPTSLVVAYLHALPSAIARLINYDYGNGLRDIGTEGARSTR